MNHSNMSNRDSGIVIKGSLARKKSTGTKNRYFVLRSETSELPAVLEKYESEEKFSNGSQPKKKYRLTDCTNIIKKTDKNNSNVIALYFNKECIALVPRSESELLDWLTHLQMHKNSNLPPDFDHDHVWQVNVLPKGVAPSQNLGGRHFLYLTDWSVTLARVDNPSEDIGFRLQNIKKCGHQNRTFFLLLGQYSGIGSGKLSLQTEDACIAQNIFKAVSSTMNYPSHRKMFDGLISKNKRNSDLEAEDNVPVGQKLQSNGGNPCSAIETIQQQSMFDPSDGKPYGSHLEETNHTPDGEESSRYLLMKSSVGESSLSSPRAPLAVFDEALEDDNAYMIMGPGTTRERQTPNTLGISPRSFLTQSELVPTLNSGGHRGLCSPVSPSLGGLSLWRSGSIGTTSSPQTLSTPHSRNPSLLDDSYVDMTSPGSQGPQISQLKSDASNHYLDMRPGSTSVLGYYERQRTMSTPTPIIHEEKCLKTCINGGVQPSSSTTSDEKMEGIEIEKKEEVSQGH